MSFMQCARKGCKKNFCRSYVAEFGFMCESCSVEFDKEFEKKNEPRRFRTLHQFKESPKLVWV